MNEYNFQPNKPAFPARMKLFFWGVLACAVIFFLFFFFIFFTGLGKSAPLKDFVVPIGTSNSDVISSLEAKGFITNTWAFGLAEKIRGTSEILPGSYHIATPVSIWNISRILAGKPDSVWAVIPPGLRKEETADILKKALGWSDDQEKNWVTKDTTVKVDYSEGVYFPDTYLIPVDEAPTDVAKRLQNEFESKFAPDEKAGLKQNIKWTTLLTLASIIQREAAGDSDRALISGILWNRLSAGMRLQIDATVQYARGNTGAGWWAPINPADEKIVSPYNTYLNKGLPPHPIDSPGLPAIDAALTPEKTDCLYYIHDSSRVIHCSATYAGQLQNIKTYL